MEVLGETLHLKILSNSERVIAAIDVMRIYKSIGWWEERREEEISLILQHGVYVGAWENDELVGFARAVTDGVFRAYIEDVIIHRSFQKEGFGKNLVAKLLEELSNIDIISLFCEEEYIPFYEHNDFKKMKSQFVMHKMNE
ncbi:GNAT family N-acetyltransferase [Bacillus sp. B1-b2]|nr:GNAT family N-acetyltransferase [Bacillus sp. B1-b2]